MSFRSLVDENFVRSILLVLGVILSLEEVMAGLAKAFMNRIVGFENVFSYAELHVAYDIVVEVINGLLYETLVRASVEQYTGVHKVKQFVLGHGIAVFISYK